MMRLLQFVGANPLKRNTLFLLTSEATAKLSRFFTLGFMAAYFSATDFAIASLTLFYFDIARMLTRSGAGLKIVQCHDWDVGAYFTGATLIQFFACCLIAIFQYSASTLVSDFYGDPRLAELLQVMIVAYFFFPLVSSRYFILQREGKMGIISSISGICLIVENLLIIAFILLDQGVMAIALAKVCSSALWALSFYLPRIAVSGSRLCRQTLISLLLFTAPVLSSDVLKFTRTQIDVLLGSLVLPLDTLGIYCFARNLGLGIAFSVISAYTSSLYPYLCTANRNGKLAQAFPFVKLFTLVLAAGFLLQAIIFPAMVTVVFGEKWADSQVILLILCLSSLSLLFIEVIGVYTKVHAKPVIDFYISLYCLFFTAASFLIIGPQSALAIALLTLFNSFCWVLISINLLPSKLHQFQSTNTFKPEGIRS